jgi:hypothetical protein
MKIVIRMGNGKTKTFNTETAAVIATKYTQGMQGYNCIYNIKFYKSKEGMYFYTYNGNLYTDWSVESHLFGTVMKFYEDIISEATHIFFGYYPPGGFETTPFMVFTNNNAQTVKLVEDIKYKKSA